MTVETQPSTPAPGTQPAPGAAGTPAASPATPAADPPGDPAAAAPPAAPAATPAPAPAAPAAAAADDDDDKKRKRIVNGEVRIPQNLFKARIAKEAKAIALATLGMPLDEAAALIKNAQAATDEASKNNASLQALQAENARLKKRLDKANRATTEWQKKHKTDIRRMQDKQIEEQIRTAAASAGVLPKAMDYAMGEFIKVAAKDKNINPQKFFAETLKAEWPSWYKGAAPAPTPEVEAGTAPPESPQPGGATPPPKASGAKPPTENVDGMNNQDFAAHTQSKYGYRPGMM